MRKRILVIDDSEEVTRAVDRVLRATYEVTVAGSPQAALERIRRGDRYDMILCDVMMPRMTASELHGVLAGELPEVAAVMMFMTGGWFGDKEAAFLRRDDITWFTKPIAAPELRERVRRFLDRLDGP